MIVYVCTSAPLWILFNVGLWTSAQVAHHTLIFEVLVREKTSL
jgi:hypothetical protein